MKEKRSYEPPMIIDLQVDHTQAVGQTVSCETGHLANSCNTGANAGNRCITGGSATSNCGTGGNASNNCGNGGSASLKCSNGGNPCVFLFW